MVYLLFYDTDGSGASEEWNVFYTPVESFSTRADRDARKAFLSTATDKHGNPCNYEFHEVELSNTVQPNAPHANS